MAWSEAARKAAAEARRLRKQANDFRYVNRLRKPKGFAKGAQARADASGWGKERAALLKLVNAEQRANNLRLVGK